jgi:hypothetical protein
VDPTEAAPAISNPDTLQVIAENYGIPGMVLFSVALFLGFLSLGAPRLIHAIKGKQEERRKNTPRPAEPRITETLLGRLTASQVRAEKDKTDESQDDRLGRIEKRQDEIEERINEVFRVLGEHKKEAAESREKIDGKIEKQRDKCDRKNEKQDRLIGGLSQSFATLEGMMRAMKGGTGLTGMFTGKTSLPPVDDE